MSPVPARRVAGRRRRRAPTGHPARVADRGSRVSHGEFKEVSGTGGRDVSGPTAVRRADRFAPKFRTIHGYRRAYVRAGRGDGLLFIHGIGDSLRTWTDVLPRFAAHRTVIAPDLLGHGLSDKPRADYSIAGYACGMRDLLGVLGIERVTVVGHSLGAGVAMQFAYQFPERCERLVLVSPGGVGRGVHPALRAGTLPGANLVLMALTSPPVRRMGQWTIRGLELAGTNLGRDADDVAGMFDRLGGVAARKSFLRTLRTSVDWRGQTITMLDRCYLTVAMPTLLIGGDHDGVIPAEHPRIAHQAMPGSRLEIFPGAGHFPHHSDPDRFVAVVEDFLEATQPASYNAQQWRALIRSGPTMPPVTPSEADRLPPCVSVPVTEEGHITSGGA